MSDQPDASATLVPLEPAPSQPADDAELARALEGFLSGLEAGRRPSAQQLIAEHPAIAERLRTCLASLQFLEQAADELSAPRAASDAEPAGGTLGDYRLLREVGRGGMGVVYEAEQISLRRRVALKVLPFASMLDPRALARFKNEALAAAQLDHPHIVDVFGVGHDRGVHYYAMRFIEGHSLAEVVAELRQRRRDRDRPLASISDALPGAATVSAVPHTVSTTVPAEDTAPATSAARTRRTRRSGGSPSYFRSIAELGGQVAAALHHAHEQGVVHRDIKPSNLLLDGRGKVWIADFGLARIEADAALTVSGDVLGTLRYMSPEQAGSRQTAIDHRTDVYSLGVTLYELLTLRTPFEAADRRDLLRRIESAPPPAPRRLDAAIPRELETIVLRCLEKDPADRYPTARDLAEDLGRFAAGELVHARRPGLARRAVRWSRRHAAALLWAGIAAGALAAASTTGAALLYRERQATIAARQTADARHDLTLEALDALIYDVQHELEPTPSTQQARTRLLHTALNGLQRLLREGGAEGEVDSRMMAAHGRIARLELLLNGASESAQRHAAESLRIASLRREHDPADRQAILDLAAAHGVAAEAARQLGDWQATRRHLEEALGVAALVAPSVDAEFQEGIVTWHGDLGVALQTLGDAAAAQQHFERAVELAESAGTAQPGARRSLMLAYDRASFGRQQAGDIQGAVALLRRSIEAADTELAASPRRDSVRRSLAVIHSRLSNLFLQTGDAAAAERHCLAALEIRRRLWSADPESALAQSDLAQSLGTLGYLCLEAERIPEATELLQERHVLVESMAAADSAGAPALQSLVSSHGDLADLAWRRQDWDGARAQYVPALRVGERIAALDRQNLDAHFRLAVTLHNVALLEAEHAGSDERVLAWVGRSVRVLEPFHRAGKLAGQALMEQSWQEWNQELSNGSSLPAPPATCGWSELAFASFAAQQWDDAVWAAERALTAAGDGPPRDQLVLGLARTHRGDGQEARAVLEEALQGLGDEPAADPQVEELRRTAAELLAGRGACPP